MKVIYEPEVISKFADALYLKADRLVKRMTIKYGFGGLIVGIVVGSFMSQKMNSGSMFIIASGIIFALVTGYLGAKDGEEKAFLIRLEAQMALCQVEIEKSSRGTNSAAA